MSRVIIISTKYRNGIKGQVGWYDVSNCDMTESTFYYSDMLSLVERFFEETKGKSKSDYATIILQKSGSLSTQFFPNITMTIRLDLLDHPDVFGTIESYFT